MDSKEILFRELENLPENLAVEVLHFVEFLKTKIQVSSDKQKEQYLDKLLQISVWSEKDIQQIEKAGEEFEKWQLP